MYSCIHVSRNFEIIFLKVAVYIILGVKANKNPKNVIDL